MQVLNLDGLDIGEDPYEDVKEIPFITSIFPSGEIFFRLGENTEIEESVVIWTRINSSDDIIRLMMATDALRRCGAQNIACYIPRLPYAQGDRVCYPGEPHALKVFGDLINSLGFYNVVVLDPHSSVCQACLDNLIIFDNSGFIGEVLDDLNVRQLNIIVPDEGAGKKIYDLTPVFEENKVEVNLVVCSKIRDLKTSKIIKTVVPKIKNDWDCLIIDDISLLGTTFINIAKELGNRKTYLAVTHGIFNGGFDELENHFDKIYCTNSYKDITHPLVTQFRI